MTGSTQPAGSRLRHGSGAAETAGRFATGEFVSGLAVLAVLAHLAVLEPVLLRLGGRIPRSSEESSEEFSQESGEKSKWGERHLATLLVMGLVFDVEFFLGWRLTNSHRFMMIRGISWKMDENGEFLDD